MVKVYKHLHLEESVYKMIIHIYISHMYTYIVSSLFAKFGVTWLISKVTKPGFCHCAAGYLPASDQRSVWSSMPPLCLRHFLGTQGLPSDSWNWCTVAFNCESQTSTLQLL